MQLDAEFIIGAITALASAVVYLWRSQVAAAAKTEAKLEKCEEGHRCANERMMELTSSVSELRGRQAGVLEMADNVLRTVAEATKNTTSKRSPESATDTGGDAS
ncbi:MAG TPA: hypothetical protein PLI18_14290 [Pirellulaceae bacterium]|nr:hypothetical protein [Pirellulaceae bacterium]